MPWAVRHVLDGEHFIGIYELSLGYVKQYMQYLLRKGSARRNEEQHVEIDIAENDPAKKSADRLGGLSEEPEPKDSNSQKETLKKKAKSPQQPSPERSEFIRAENEDDDGYDPYSDRRPEIEPLFEQDPWL